MSRPKPSVILDNVDNNNRAIWVCEADAVYAVCYQGRPIMVKTQADINHNYPGPKYAKTMYPSAGHAFNLADKLNQTFDTQDFTVVIMTVGRTIREK